MMRCDAMRCDAQNECPSFGGLGVSPPLAQLGNEMGRREIVTGRVDSEPGPSAPGVGCRGCALSWIGESTSRAASGLGPAATATSGPIAGPGAWRRRRRRAWSTAVSTFRVKPQWQHLTCRRTHRQCRVSQRTMLWPGRRSCTYRSARSGIVLCAVETRCVHFIGSRQMPDLILLVHATTPSAATRHVATPASSTYTLPASTHDSNRQCRPPTPSDSPRGGASSTAPPASWPARNPSPPNAASTSSAQAATRLCVSFPTLR